MYTPPRGDLREERQHSPGLQEAGMAGFGLTTGMGTDEGPGGCLTSRAHIAGMGTDEGPGGLLTSRAHVASVRTDEGPGLRTSRAHAGMVQGNGGLPADPWMEYILRQQQQQQGGPGGVQQGCLGSTGHWVNRTQFVPVPPSVTSRSGSTAMHSGSGPVGLTHSFGAQDATGVGHQGGMGSPGVDPVQQARALLQGMNFSQVQSTLRIAGDVYSRQGTDSFLNALERYRRDKEKQVCSYRILRREVCRCPEGNTHDSKGGTEITGMFSLRVRSGLEARRLHLRRNGLGAKACYWFFRNYVSETFKCEWSVEQPCLVSTLHSRWCSLTIAS